MKSSRGLVVIKPSPPKWSVSPEPRGRTQSSHHHPSALAVARLAVRPDDPDRWATPNRRQPSTPTSRPPLPASNFTPTDKQTLEYEEEDDSDELDETHSHQPLAAPESEVLPASSDLSAEEDEMSAELDTESTKAPVQTTLTGLGNKWRSSRKESEAKADAAPKNHSHPTKQTKLSFREKLAEFASQNSKIDLTLTEDEEQEDDHDEEVAVVTRPVAVDPQDLPHSFDPSSEGIDDDIEEFLDDGQREPRKNVLRTADLPGIDPPARYTHPVADDDGIQDNFTYVADAEGATPNEGGVQTDMLMSEIASRKSSKEVTAKCDLDQIRRRYKIERKRQRQRILRQVNANQALEHELLPVAGLDNQNAVEVDRTLSKVIRKEDFATFRVLGQFNQAFIVVRRETAESPTTVGSDDLFIIGNCHPQLRK